MLSLMRISLLAVAVALGAAGMFYLGTTGTSDSDVEVREDAARGFNMAMPAAGPRRPAAVVPIEPLHDAVAPARAPSAPAAAAPAALPNKQPASPSETARPKEPTKTARAGFTALLASPANYIASKTMLGRPGQFAAQVQRKDFGKAYVMTPVVRMVLESPTLVKAVLTNETLLNAFLTSPAMKDPKAVQALADSALLQYVLTSKGVMTAFSDPAVYQHTLMSPRTAMWAGSSPQARAALGRLTSAIAASPRG